MIFAIRCRSGKVVRVEACVHRFDGFGDRLFCAHNSVDNYREEIMEDHFTVTDYATGIAIANQIYGTVEDALRVADTKIASLGVQHIARILSNATIINKEHDDEWKQTAITG